MTDHNISSLCTRSHEISKSKGWLENPRPFHTLCLLMHSEVSEALEDYRNNKGINETYYEAAFEDVSDSKRSFKLTLSKAQLNEEGFKKIFGEMAPPPKLVSAKPCGIPIEFADVVIRIAQWAGTAGIGEWFEEEYGHITRGCTPMTDDFEEVLAWVHVDIAAATKHEYQLREGLIDNNEGVPTDQHSMVIHHLANAVWRLFKLSDAHKIDLWAAIDEKEAFNKTRPKMHGGKKI